eukprot:TRINITY_DN3638_c0_g2_i1.p1 TRINITY_DN3638_c0_g2~~TRINITY_DN3638_c0_g2_i1.p1  ORF type:complete len:527 (+),score=99.12 TRINITY_DN3638_c0_g2_i1:93-1673(+)
MTPGVLFSVILLSILSVSVGNPSSDDFSLKTKVSLQPNLSYYLVPLQLPASGNSSFTFSVSSSVPLSSLSSTISVCFREYFYPYLEASDWSEESCGVFLSMKSSNSTKMSQTFVDPSPGTYYTTIFLPLHHANTSGELDLEISGLKCDGGSFGIGCQTQEQVIQIGVEYNIPLSTPSENFIGSFYLSSDVNQLLFKAEISSTAHSSPLTSSSESSASLSRRRRRRSTDEYIFALRYENAFMDKREKDAYTLVLKSNINSSSLVVPVPRPGKWFLSVFTTAGVYSRPSAASLSAKFQIQTTECLNNTKGSDCQSIQLLKQEPLHKLKSSSEVTYLAFSVRDLFNQSNNETSNFSVFLSYTDLSPHAPKIWLRYAQVPSELSYDAISVGNTSVSNLTLTFPPESNQTNSDGLFYIAVAKGAKNMILWYNELCPNSCSGKGKCIFNSAESIYKCKCNAGYESYDCTVESERMSDLQVSLLLAAYMVGLVLGLGVIGFAFHRHEIREFLKERKKAKYTDPSASPLLANDD